MRVSTIPAEATQQLEQVVGVFGGVEGLVGWIGDVAVVVNDPGEGFEGGLLIQPTDATKAENLFLTIRGMLSLGGASMGLTVTDEQHGDATITTVDFGELRTLMDMTGESVPAADLDMFGGADAHLQLSWTVTDDLVVVGLGPDFVRHVLDTEPGASLAQSDRFESLLARTGTENAGQWFVDVAAIRLALEAARRGCAGDAPELRGRGEALPRAVRRAGRVDGHRRFESRQGNVPDHSQVTGGDARPMAVRIRLTRVGATKQPSYRVVVADCAQCA